MNEVIRRLERLRSKIPGSSPDLKEELEEVIRYAREVQREVLVLARKNYEHVQRMHAAESLLEAAERFDDYCRSK